MSSSSYVESLVLPQQRTLGLSAEQAYSVAALLVDAALITLASIASGMAFHMAVHGVRGDVDAFAATGVIAAVLFCSFLRIQGTHKRRADFTGAGRVRTAVVVWTLTFLFLIVLAFGLKISSQFSRGTIFTFYLTGMATVAASRLVTPRLLAQWSATNAYRGMEILIVAPCADERADRLRATLAALGGRQVRVIEFNDRCATSAEWDGERRRTVQAIFNAAHSAAPGPIYVLGGALDAPALGHLLSLLRPIPRVVYLVPDDHTSALLHQDMKTVGGMAAVEMQKTPLNRFERCAKRLFDVLASFAGIVFCAPLLALIAIAIKLDSPGPIFFRQHRHGYRGKLFRIVKFRTMTVLEDGANVTQATRNDNRVTRVGALLRKSSLDELPQLWNVLCGDMSLVGPRPHAVAHDRLYSELIENYEVRQHVRPGITGWAQIHGLRGETPNLDSMYRRIEMDIWYATNCTLLLDAQILARTVIEVMRQRNAY